MSNRVYYLVSPYSHKDKEVVKERYLLQQKIGAHLISELDMIVIMPIEMCHTIAQKFNLPSGYEYWQNRDREFIRRSDGIIVCLMDGLEESAGCRDEIHFCKALGKEVLYFDLEKWELVNEREYKRKNRKG